MAGLKIFGTDPENQPKPRQTFANDVVGRFRSGHQINDRPQALTEWRVTTGDPEVAAKVFDLLGGDAPQEWPSRGEDNLEVFSASASVDIILEGPRALRQRMILWGRNGKPIRESDGETITSGDDIGKPDPDAALTLAERKKRAKDGVGAEPSIEVYFRLAHEPDLGIFKYQTGSWSLAQDIVRDGTDDLLTDAIGDSETGKARATLTLEPVSFVAKNGPAAGQTINYTKPVLKILGPVKGGEPTDVGGFSGKAPF
jgi:hypothetical protein